MHLQFGRSCEKGLEHRFSNPRRTPPLAPQEMLLRGILSPPALAGKGVGGLGFY